MNNKIEFNCFIYYFTFGRLEKAKENEKKSMEKKKEKKELHQQL